MTDKMLALPHSKARSYKTDPPSIFKGSPQWGQRRGQYGGMPIVQVLRFLRYNNQEYCNITEDMISWAM
jgi:hypothetical protein